MPRFIHPLHSRGLRSPALPSGSSKPLTDRRISEYMLEGKYGPEAMARELARLEKKKQPPSGGGTASSPSTSSPKISRRSINLIIQDLI